MRKNRTLLPPLGVYKVEKRGNKFLRLYDDVVITERRNKERANQGLDQKSFVYSLLLFSSFSFTITGGSVTLGCAMLLSCLIQISHVEQAIFLCVTLETHAPPHPTMEFEEGRGRGLHSPGTPLLSRVENGQVGSIRCHDGDSASWRRTWRPVFVQDHMSMK